MARPSAPARSPRARAPRADRAAPRGRRGGRRPAPASLRDELVTGLGLDVSDLPPRAGDLFPQTIGTLEITLLTRCGASGRQLVNRLGGRFDGHQIGQPEDLEPISDPI